jgi:nicotinate-nucleotide--dimethylbenzimidazole phosphoribosyltransferase
VSTSLSGALIPSVANAALERDIRAKLERRRSSAGSFGILEPLALRIGLVQGSRSPRLTSARLVVFAADHGLAVDGIGGPGARPTAEAVQELGDESTPLVALANAQGIELTVVDSGVAETLAPHSRLLPRKIAHATRNCRVGAAMTTEQAHAALRAGMEIGQTLAGSAVACAGIGRASEACAALLLSCTSGAPLREFVDSAPTTNKVVRDHLLRVLEEARNRHGHLDDPVELLAAVGGFEIAMMTGLMLAAAGRRRLIVADGIAACAALLIAAQIAPAVPDYCLCARSSPSSALGNAFELIGAKPVVDLGIDSVEGTGATLAWPILRAASALLVDSDTPQNGGRTASQRVDSGSPASQR